MVVEIGSHSFSEMDARQTLAMAVELFELRSVDFPVSSDRLRRVSSALEDSDPSSDPVDVVAAAVRVVWTELLDAREDAVNLPLRTVVGAVAQVSLSDGGIPKLAVDRIDVDFGGVVGDRQAARRHHGRPWQALCLWSSQVIAQLVDEGHPITPGSAGENITIAGLPWADVRPGNRMRIGTVLCEISSFAVPCSKNAQWFSDRDVSRIHHDNGNLSRLYATVLEPGWIAVSDQAILEPA
jgi:MOSC domain-containing protein YiiM